MLAARLHEIGSTLHADDIDEPAVGGDESLVEIDYASVNPLDVWITKGGIGAAASNLPWIPGTEAAGHIDNRQVLVRGGGLGVVRPGLYRQRIAVTDDCLIDVPPGLAMEQVAAVPVAGITAWQAVHTRGRVSSDDRVVVLGASGGVGAMAVQLAKLAGAVVWGQTGQTSKVDSIRANGADQIVVCDADGLAAGIADLKPTVVLDALGGGFTDAAIAALEPKGRLVVYGTSNAELVTINLRQLYRKGIDLLGYAGLVDTPAEQREIITTLLGLMAAGQLSVPVGTVLPLAAAADAHAMILERRAEGKIVLDCR